MFDIHSGRFGLHVYNYRIGATSVCRIVEKNAGATSSNSSNYLLLSRGVVRVGQWEQLHLSIFFENKAQHALEFNNLNKIYQEVSPGVSHFSHFEW